MIADAIRTGTLQPNAQGGWRDVYSKLSRQRLPYGIRQGGEHVIWNGVDALHNPPHGSILLSLLDRNDTLVNYTAIA